MPRSSSFYEAPWPTPAGCLERSPGKAAPDAIRRDSPDGSGRDDQANVSHQRWPAGEVELSTKPGTSRSLKDTSSSQQIDAKIKALGDWRGKKLAQLRALIKRADAGIIEEVKWKKPSNP